MEPLRHVGKVGFGAVIFRRTSPEIKSEGGLWDTSGKIYPYVGGVPRESATEWRWDTGATVGFSHLQHEKDKYNWNGSAIPLIGFDELQRFSKSQFFYLISRNRLTHDCGMLPYVRATCNPDTGWLGDFIAWWIDQETGFPIPERDGVLRWFIQKDEKLVWGDSREKLVEEYPKSLPKSVTFIAAKVTDNPTLLRQDPGYLANLSALPRFERMQLLEGNWKVRPVAGMFFQRPWFKIVDAVPAQGKTVRYWDRAATEPIAGSNPDWTVGLKMRRTPSGEFYVLDVVRFRSRPLEVKRQIRAVASQDGADCQVWLEEDPGQAGKSEIQDLIRELAGFPVYANRVTTSKVTRALPVSAHSEAGNIHIMRGAWNDGFLNELESFCDEDQLPTSLKPSEKSKKDQVDAFSGAFNMLAQSVGGPSIR